MIKEYTKGLVCNLNIPPTDGKATVAKAKDTFPGYINGDFKGWGCDVKSEPTEKTQVTVHEMIKGGTFAQIFGGMSDDLNSLCLTQPQIIQFVEKHKKWLRTDGYGTFFLFKVGEEFFVAYVYFDGDGPLEVHVRRLSSDYVWDAEYRHRIVVPQLAIKDLDSFHLEPTSLDLAIETVKKAGYTVIKTTKWYITGRGQVMEMSPNDKTDDRRKFLGSYPTKKEAEYVRDLIRSSYGED